MFGFGRVVFGPAVRAGTPSSQSGSDGGRGSSVTEDPPHDSSSSWGMGTQGVADRKLTDLAPDIDACVAREAEVESPRRTRSR